MSKFAKLLLTLIFILIIEIALIIFGLLHKDTYNTKIQINNYTLRKSIATSAVITTNNSEVTKK